MPNCIELPCKLLGRFFTFGNMYLVIWPVAALPVSGKVLGAMPLNNDTILSHSLIALTLSLSDFTFCGFRLGLTFCHFFFCVCLLI